MVRLVAISLLGILLTVGCGGLYGTPAAPAAQPTSAQPSGTAPGGTAATGQVVEVAMQGFAFNPGTVTVAPGTTVVWTNRDGMAHTVTGDKGAFDSSSLSPGKAFSYKFAQAGTYDYHCAFHADMTASVVVK